MAFTEKLIGHGHEHGNYHGGFIGNKQFSWNYDKALSVITIIHNNDEFAYINMNDAISPRFVNTKPTVGTPSTGFKWEWDGTNTRFDFTRVDTGDVETAVLARIDSTGLVSL